MLTNLDDSHRRIVKVEDVIRGPGRDGADKGFDRVFMRRRSIQYLDRKVILELSAIDGAVVLNKSGEMKAYGAVIKSKNKKKYTHEGSRTQAALFASQYGTCVKISSDGDIKVFKNEIEVIGV